MRLTDLAERTKMRARVRVKQWIKTGAALRSALLPAVDRGVPPGVVVLMYHRVNDVRRNELTVSTHAFRRQLQWLRAAGFENLRVEDLESFAARGEAPPRGKWVVFSFDDGYEDNVTHALPVLKEHGYTAIFYLAADYTGTDRMYPLDRRESGRLADNRVMTWEQAAGLLREGMEIGSHSLDHVVLTAAPDARAQHEIVASKEQIAGKLGIEVTSFCYPEGRFAPRHARMVRAAGYRSAFTTEPGFWRGGDMFTIPRLAVLASDSFFVFKMKVTARMAWFRAVR